MPKITLLCQRCSKPFDVWPSQMHQKYCTPLCANTAHRRPMADRFWEKVMKTDGCWWWTGAAVEKGYGRFLRKSGGHMATAHRVAWELTIGPVPDGLFVLHSCDIKWPPDVFIYRLCVNPAHLFLGTIKDNALDMAAKGRSTKGRKMPNPPRGERQGKAKLTDDMVREARIRRANGESQTAIALDFGVNQSAISDIILGKTWTHVR